MQAPLSFLDIQERCGAVPLQWAARSLVDPEAERAALIASGRLRVAQNAQPCFAVDDRYRLDDDAVKAAAMQILRTEIGGSEHRLKRVLQQADPRVGSAIRALVARRGLPREVA